MPISFAQLHASKLDVADVSADLDSLYGEKTSYSKQLSSKCAYLTTLCLQRFCCLQSVLRAGW